MTIEKKD